MIRRYRSQSLSDPKRSDNANTFKRSGSVQDLKVLGGRKDMLNKRKTKLTRQESVEIRANDEGECVNMKMSCIRRKLDIINDSAGYLKSHPELTSALQKLFIHLCQKAQDDDDDTKDPEDCLLSSAVDFFADQKY